jgi:hypothetical protein
MFDSAVNLPKEWRILEGCALGRHAGAVPANSQCLMALVMRSSSVIERASKSEIGGSVAATTGRERGGLSPAHRPLTWLNIWCLDAPLVAVGWQWLFARSFNVTLPTASRAALFLTAWFIYLVDRFADSISLAPFLPKSARQEFCSRHRFSWIALMSATAVLDSAIVLTRLDSTTLRHGVLLGTVAVTYLAINGLFSAVWETLPMKEIAIGLLFSAGTLLAVAPHVSVALPVFALAALLFAGVCSLNCVSIAVWERQLDVSQQKHSIATRWRRMNGDLRIFSMLLTAGCLVLALVDHKSWQLGLCLGSSAVLLGVLPSFPVARDEETALADLVLLTPLLLMFIERLL